MMGESMEDENAAFWLPSHFLTDDDFLCSHPKPTNSGFGSDPYPDSPLSSSPDKPAERGNDSDYIAELTRYLARSSLLDSLPNNTEKAWRMSTSPQSTLTGFGPSGFSTNGSPNGQSQVPSPPLTPELKNDAAWDLLYEAAGQVARLKMNAISAHLNARTHQGLLTAARQPTTKPRHLYTTNNQYEHVKWDQENHLMRQQQERENNLYCPYHNHQKHRHEYHQQQQRSCCGTLGLPQSAWPALSHRQGHNNLYRQGDCGAQHKMRGMYVGGTRGGVGPVGGVKRQSTGTGVFIPRRTTTPPRQLFQPEPRRKPSVVVPAGVVQTLNLDVEDANLNSHSRFTTGFPSQHDIMLAKRNAIVAQQRRNNMRSNEKSTGAATMVGQGRHEIRLPTDWTY